MEFKIPCETYLRLSNAVQHFKPTETREYLRSIYVEQKNGSIVAVATNAMILAAEYIGPGDGPGWNIHLTIDLALLAQCRNEAPFGGQLSIVYNETLKFASAKTTFGYNYPGNAALHFVGMNDTRDKWRTLYEPVGKSWGVMAFKAECVADLGAASPSGEIIFPQHIDASKPVLVRDSIDPKWMGLFMPFLIENGEAVEHPPAILPDWMTAL